MTQIASIFSINNWNVWKIYCICWDLLIYVNLAIFCSMVLLKFCFPKMVTWETNIVEGWNILILIILSLSPLYDCVQDFILFYFLGQFYLHTFASWAFCLAPALSNMTMLPIYSHISLNNPLWIFSGIKRQEITCCTNIK